MEGGKGRVSEALALHKLLVAPPAHAQQASRRAARSKGAHPIAAVAREVDQEADGNRNLEGDFEGLEAERDWTGALRDEE
jgi:hypothetical protein